MVSIRRRRLLGLCSGGNSFSGSVPRANGNDQSPGSWNQNTRSVIVHPIPSVEVTQPDEKKVPEVGPESSTADGSNARKEQIQQFPAPVEERSPSTRAVKRAKKSILENEEKEGKNNRDDDVEIHDNVKEEGEEEEDEQEHDGKNTHDEEVDKKEVKEEEDMEHEEDEKNTHDNEVEIHGNEEDIEEKEIEDEVEDKGEGAECDSSLINSDEESDDDIQANGGDDDATVDEGEKSEDDGEIID